MNQVVLSLDAKGNVKDSGGNANGKYGNDDKYENHNDNNNPSVACSIPDDDLPRGYRVTKEHKRCPKSGALVLPWRNSEATIRMLYEGSNTNSNGNSASNSSSSSAKSSSNSEDSVEFATATEFLAHMLQHNEQGANLFFDKHLSLGDGSTSEKRGSTLSGKGKTDKKTLQTHMKLVTHVKWLEEMRKRALRVREKYDFSSMSYPPHFEYDPNGTQQGVEGVKQSVEGWRIPDASRHNRGGRCPAGTPKFLICEMIRNSNDKLTEMTTFIPISRCIYY
jgi:hypothetical protein